MPRQHHIYSIAVDHPSGAGLSAAQITEVEMVEFVERKKVLIAKIDNVCNIFVLHELLCDELKDIASTWFAKSIE